MKSYRTLFVAVALAAVASACGGAGMQTGSAPASPSSPTDEVATAASAVASACLSPGVNQVTASETGILSIESGPLLSPDGMTFTVIAQRTAMGDTDGNPDALEFYSLPCDGGAATRLTDFNDMSTRFVESVTMSASADNTMVALEVNHHLFTVDLSTGEYVYFDNGSNPVMTGDGLYVMYVNENGALAFVSSDGGNPEIIVPAGYGIVGLALNHTRTAALFTSRSDITGQNPDGSFELFMVTRDNGAFGIEQMTDGAANIHSGLGYFTADDEWVAYQTVSKTLGQNPDGSVQIMVARLDGSQKYQLTQFRQNRDLTYSVASADQSTAIVRASADPSGENPTRSWQLFRYNAEDMSGPQITWGQSGRMSLPAVSSDGARVAFISDGDPLGTNPNHKPQLFYYVHDSAAGSESEGSMK